MMWLTIKNVLLQNWPFNNAERSENQCLLFFKGEPAKQIKLLLGVFFCCHNVRILVFLSRFLCMRCEAWKRYECLVLNKCDSVQDWEHLAVQLLQSQPWLLHRGEIRRPTIHGLLPLGVHTGALLLTRGRGI